VSHLTNPGTRDPILNIETTFKFSHQMRQQWKVGLGEIKAPQTSTITDSAHELRKQYCLGRPPNAHYYLNVYLRAAYVESSDRIGLQEDCAARIPTSPLLFLSTADLQRYVQRMKTVIVFLCSFLRHVHRNCHQT